MDLIVLAHKWKLWFHPIEWLIHYVRRTILFALPICCLVTITAAYYANQRFGNTYATSIVLRYQKAAQAPEINTKIKSYQAPQFNLKEAVTWLYKWEHYEKIYPESMRDDGVKTLKSLINIKTHEETGHIVVDYRGAFSPDSAVQTLEAFSEQIIRYGYDMIQSRINKDLLLAKQQFHNHAKLVQAHQLELITFGNETGMMESDEEVRQRMERYFILIRDADDAKAELTYAEERMRRLPILIAELPAEVPGSRSVITERNIQLKKLQQELHQIESVYTKNSPRYKAKRDEFALFMANDQDGNATFSPDNYERNPTRDLLMHELAQLKLSIPDLRANSIRLQKNMKNAKADLHRIPGDVIKLRTMTNNLENAMMSSLHLKNRVAEIELAQHMAESPLEIATKPNVAYVDIKKKSFKVGIISLVSACASLLTVASVVLFFRIRDGRIASTKAAQVAFGTHNAYPVVASDIGSCTPAYRRVLRRSIDNMIKKGSLSIITSPCSTWTQCCTLSEDLAQQAGRMELKALLITSDADNSKPSLASVLDDDFSISAAIRTDAHGNATLRLGDADRLEDHLTNGRALQFFREGRDVFDIILIAIPEREDFVIEHLVEVSTSIGTIVANEERGGARFAHKLNRYQTPVVNAMLIGPT